MRGSPTRGLDPTLKIVPKGPVEPTLKIVPQGSKSLSSQAKSNVEVFSVSQMGEIVHCLLQ